VEERRKFERGANLIGLLRLARKTFDAFPRASFHINLKGARIAF